MPAVWFEGNCIKCAMCVDEAKDVFVFVETTGPQVREGVDIAAHSEDIKRAEQFCPTKYIKYQL